MALCLIDVAPEATRLVDGAGALRLAIFVTLLVGFSLWESRAPRRTATTGRNRRWLGNGLLMLLGTLVARLAVPAGAIGTALWAEARGIGLLQLVDLPRALEIAAAVVLLDLALYAQHVASHRVALFWRIHRVHHADLDLDTSSGIRFHPLEILLSLLWKAACVAALGAAPLAVLVSETILSSMSLFTHANLALPRSVDRVLRLLVVTPDVHRVHHSTESDESNRNFGFAILAWDRIFGTYRSEPRAPHDSMPLGLADLRDPDGTTGAGALLALPFRASSARR